MNDYDFIVNGIMTIDSNLKPKLDSYGEISSFRLADGRTARLVVCLEVEGNNGKEATVEYIFSEKNMEKIGFMLNDYQELKWVKRGLVSPDAN